MDIEETVKAHQYLCVPLYFPTSLAALLDNRMWAIRASHFWAEVVKQIMSFPYAPSFPNMQLDAKEVVGQQTRRERY